MKNLLLPDEVAQLLGKTRRTIYRMIADGRLPGVNPRRGPLRVPREAVVDLIKGRVG